MDGILERGFERAATTRQNAVGFQMVMLQKLLASSSRALLTSLLGRRMRLLGDARPARARTGCRGDGLGRGCRSPRTSSRIWRPIVGASYRVRRRHPSAREHRDATRRPRVLVDQLEQLFADPEEPDAKVLIFTEFRETQDMLADTSGDPWPTCTSSTAS